MEAPRRISDALFRRDMLSPTFGNLAASLIGLLLVEKLVMDYLLPPWVPALESTLLAYGKHQFTFVAGSLVFAIAFWGFGTLMALPAFVGARKWKIQPNKSLNVGELLGSMPLICLNFVLGAVLVPLAFCAFLPERSFNMQVLPTARDLARDIAVWMAVEEVVFYHFHRLFHTNKRLYAAIHKLHHTWTAPISYVAIYSNPVEHVLCNLLPLVLGPVLCGSHVLAILVFVFIGLLHTLAVHSGYWFCDDNGMHDEHHAKFNVNFGVSGVLDAWYGTYRLPAGAAGAAPAAKQE